MPAPTKRKARSALGEGGFWEPVGTWSSAGLGSGGEGAGSWLSAGRGRGRERGIVVDLLVQLFGRRASGEALFSKPGAVPRFVQARPGVMGP